MTESYSANKNEISGLSYQIAWLEEAVENAKRSSDKMRESLGARFKTRTFETFDESLQTVAFDVCKNYAENFSEIKDKNRNSLLLMGSYGTGKTHLASAIANDLIDKGVVVRFGTWEGLLTQIREGFDTDTNVVRKFKSAQLLVIDDFGKDKSSEWNDAILFEIINHRYEANLPTVITTNLSGRDLMNRVGQAIYSRMSETFRGVKMIGEDQRRKGVINE